MPKGYQIGGAVEDEELFAPDAGGAGALSNLDPTTALMSVFAQQYTTTPEAQAFSRRFLDDILATQSQPAASAAIDAKRAQAEQVRQALRTARERLSAQSGYDRGEILLAIGQGLGAPTRSGAIGETAGNVAGQLRAPIAAGRQFELDRDKAMTELDLAEANVEAGVTDAEFELEKLREQLRNRMAVEALQNLGKTTSLSNRLGTVIPEAAKALDAEYVKDHNLFLQGGAPKAAQGLATLRLAEDILRSGSDALTGPYAGAVASLPGVGRWLQAYTSPEGADVRDLIEQTVQESLRPILGSQFTEREGERLIQRMYNPNLEEWRNARRLNWFIQQLEEAYRNRAALADYFQQNGTLFGYQGKLYYTADDFTPPPGFDTAGGESGSGRGDERVNFTDLPPEEKEMAINLWREMNPGKEPPEWMFESIQQTRARGGAVRYKRGGKVRRQRYQAGGIAFEEPREASALEDFQRWWEEHQDPVGMAGGAATGLLADSALDTLMQRIVGGRERRVADAITRGGQDPVAVAEDIKRNRRAGVPDTLMDTDTAAIRALSEEAFRYGEAGAENALRELRNRVEGGRERVNQQINRGLKPDEYFDQENRLVQRLTGENRDQFKRVFDMYQGLEMDPVITEIISTPEGKRAMDWAFKFYQNVPGRQAGTTDLQGMITKPSLEFYDYLVKGFDQSIAREERSGPTEFSEVIRNLRQTLVDRLDTMAPEYQHVRQENGDDLAVRDSLRAGRDFMQLQPEQLKELKDKLSFHELNAFRTGMAQNLYERMDRPSAAGFNAAQTIAGSPGMMERLRPFFDNERQFKLFQTALEREAEMFRTGRETLNLGEAARMQREKTRQSPVEYMAQRGPGFRFSISPTGWFLRIMRDMPKMTETEANQVLGILRKGTPEEMNAFADRVKRLRMLRATRSPRRAAAAAIGAGAGLLLGNDEPQE